MLSDLDLFTSVTGVVAEVEDTSPLTVLDSLIDGNDIGIEAFLSDGAGTVVNHTQILSSRIQGICAGADDPGTSFVLSSSTVDGTAGPCTTSFTLSTITANSTGTGIAVAGGASAQLDSTIASGNSPTEPDLTAEDCATVTTAWSLIGTEFADGGTIIHGSGTRAGVLDTPLGPLTDNGGPTSTHLPSLTSPAVDHGNPALTHSTATPTFDQRGTGFPRVVGGRVDIGAVDTQAQADTLPDTGSAAGDAEALAVGVLALVLGLGLVAATRRGRGSWGISGRPTP